ncbi:ribonucleoside-triphosphate reductase, adenosylcobalamin-dependent [Leptolyngbya sp. CCY15150]|uniref:ribonucleoside-triphosphate reductase, adenosylcobalamin-dependent n=1 Tax=Leptolyngbya sp. CCY15150 TaxID=2767772 RepID=UPI0019517BBB|nr:ribonucleoside-triphosphate reductase, adenosylcobalamin-dependent [Leptolyngbya sp. CCY15150]
MIQSRISPQRQDNLDQTRQASQFPDYAPAANSVFYRTYSRRGEDGANLRETWKQVCDRTLNGLKELGNLTDEEAALIERMQTELKALPSGRWLWVGGTDWIKKPENFSGAYNCTSTNVDDWRAFGLMMDLAMMGCGTGAVLEPHYIGKLPAIRNLLTVDMQGEIGATPVSDRQEETRVTIEGDRVVIQVGDSRQGWVKSYQTVLELASDERFNAAVQVTIDLSDVRPAGERLKGFGGMANPIRLPKLYARCATILNKAIGRQLTSVECCLLIDEAAACVVAGNIRRCLPEDALVHTDHGLVAIKDVKVGDFVQTPLGFRRVTNKFDQGVQDVYEIETNGPLPRATLNHRVAVLADVKGEIQWKQVDQLEAGDRLMHSTQVLPGTVTTLPADFTADRPEQSRTAKHVAIPSLTADVAWLIGYTHGDGYVALGRNKHNKPYGRVEWAMNANDGVLTQRLQAKLDRALAQFGLTATHGIVNGENTAKSVCSSIRLAEYFHRHIKQPTQPLTIPTFILQGSIDIRAAYLAGLMDSDGAVNNRPPHLVTTVYPAFARQAAAVLSSLGIAGRVRLIRPQKENWQVKYNVTLPAFKGQYNSLIAPHSVKGELRQGLKMYGFTVPASLMREIYTYSEMRGMGFQGSRQVDSNYERYIAEADVNLDIPVTVEGIGSYTSIQTYDIEVEEAHCFYCDGYLTHNSAGMRQFAEGDEVAASAKENLWQQDENGNWRIDPERDVLRMANHTRVFHHKPSLDECTAAVRKQYYSGEGAIQWAGEAERRAQGKGRYGLNPCGEIIGQQFHCNLAEIHLNQLDPNNLQEQEAAFTAGALAVATLLNHQFVEPRYRQSRLEDPIVGVSFTGLFDFFVNAFGVEWLHWWTEGRPDTVRGLEFKAQEQAYLSRWKDIVHQVVWDYCDRHGIKRPNRCTTVQPAGTKSLLTGASPGWHPPKAQRFIRRITFRKDDPVALACRDYGYSLIPSQSDKDETGNLLNDPFDPRCTEWLVELPVEVPWANIPGADQVDISKFSALAQFDFYMQVQQHYTTHNTSATIELREPEIEPLATRIYEAIRDDQGYISAALLARFDDLQTFPRLPFEPVDKATYEELRQQVLQRQQTDDFYAALCRYDAGELMEAGPAGCDSDKCMMPEQKPG